MEIARLLEQGDKALAHVPPHPSLAVQFYRKAFTVDSENPTVQTKYADTLCQTGENLDLAAKLFRETIKTWSEQHLVPATPSSAPAPASLPGDYGAKPPSLLLSEERIARNLLSLGQLTAGQEALQCYTKGIRLLSNLEERSYSEAVNGETAETSRPGSPNGTDFSELIASASCAIAELYMTDLCDENEAQQCCLQYITAAIERRPESFEAHCAMAQYQKVLGNLEEARKSANLCKTLMERDQEKLDSVVSIETRVNLCRTLIDICDAPAAVSILEGCLLEDEEDMQVWYVMGCALLVDGNVDEAKEAAEKAKRLLEETGLAEDPECDMNVAVEELLRQIQKKMEGQRTMK